MRRILILLHVNDVDGRAAETIAQLRQLGEIGGSIEIHLDGSAGIASSSSTAAVVVIEGVIGLTSGRVAAVNDVLLPAVGTVAARPHRTAGSGTSLLELLFLLLGVAVIHRIKITDVLLQGFNWFQCRFGSQSARIALSIRSWRIQEDPRPTCDWLLSLFLLQLLIPAGVDGVPATFGTSIPFR